MDDKVKYTDFVQDTWVCRLAEKPEPVYDKKDGALTKLRIAVNPTPDPEKTFYMTVLCWGQQARFASEHLDTGDQLLIAGRLQGNNYESKKTKQKVYSYEFNAASVTLLRKKGQRQAPTQDEMETTPPPRTSQRVPPPDRPRGRSGLPEHVLAMQHEDTDVDETSEHDDNIPF